MMNSVDPIRSDLSTTSCLHSRMYHPDTGNPCPYVVDGLISEPPVHGAVTLHKIIVAARSSSTVRPPLY